MEWLKTPYIMKRKQMRICTLANGGLKKADFGWKDAPGHIKEFIISEEQRRFKGYICKVCIMCVVVLAFLYGWIYLFEASDLESIRNQKAWYEYCAENTKTSEIERFSDTLDKINGNRTPESDHIPDEMTVKISYLLRYLFITGLSGLIAFLLIRMDYKEFDDFRIRSLRICYGRCVGKESVYLRCGSYFTVDLCLNDKTMQKAVPVREAVGKNVENGDWLIVANCCYSICLTICKYSRQLYLP